MRRPPARGVVLAVVLVAATVVGVVARQPPSSGSEGVEARTPVEFVAGPTTVTSMVTEAETETETETETDRLVVVRGQGLTPEVVAALAFLPAADAAITVASEQAVLTGSADAAGVIVDDPPPGFGIPLEVVGVDLAAYADLLTDETAAAALAALAPGEALLSETSAHLRAVGAGGSVEIDDHAFRVAGVLPDGAVGGAELVLSTGDAASVGVSRLRRLILRPSGTVAALRASAEATVAGLADLRVGTLSGGPGGHPIAGWMPLVELKARYGEFAFRPTEGRSIEIEPGWVSEHVVTADVPILGSVLCNRAMVPALRAVLSELEDGGLAQLIDPAQYAGCFNPRLIRPGAAISRHAWGLAVDLNVATNANGTPGDMDPRVVAAFEDHGFTWAGRWTTPDPMHFEYRGN